MDSRCVRKYAMVVRSDNEFTYRKDKDMQHTNILFFLNLSIPFFGLLVPRTVYAAAQLSYSIQSSGSTSDGLDYLRNGLSSGAGDMDSADAVLQTHTHAYRWVLQ